MSNVQVLEPIGLTENNTGTLYDCLKMIFIDEHDLVSQDLYCLHCLHGDIRLRPILIGTQDRRLASTDQY